MREIPLTKGQIALVDDEDYAKLSQFKWRARKDGNNWYAETTKKPNVPGSMHRMILGLSDKSVQVDHRDRNGLNNQKSNLRVCTAAQNQANSRKHLDARTSKYKGVSRHVKTSRWYAHITISNKRTFIGSFESEIAAAKAYDAAAIARHGEFAHVNFPTEEVRQHGG